MNLISMQALLCLIYMLGTISAVCVYCMMYRIMYEDGIVFVIVFLLSSNVLLIPS